MNVKYSSRMDVVRGSDIREMLKMTQNLDVIYFAGGLPAAELFPTKALGELAKEVIEKEGFRALQYSPTEGYIGLREALVDRLNKVWKAHTTVDQIMITTGSQQGLDLTAKVFLDQGDYVVCERPTYVGAVMAFTLFQPRWIEVPCDDDGMDMAALDAALKNNPRVKFIYIVPNFQNPSGRTWSLERRRQTLAIAAKYDIPIIEDNPYGELYFDEDQPTAIQELDTEGRVISLGTLSKTFCPGLRLGWVNANEEILRKYGLIKQATDLNTSTLDQMIAAWYLQKYDFEADVAEKRIVYRNRRDAMVKAIHEEMPPEIRFVKPRGGLFLWLELPKQINARTVMRRCFERGVAVCPGEGFYPQSPELNTLRLNFSCMPEERIREGIRRLATVMREMLAEAALEQPIEV
jgi:DNA-binding transcriptional MocR family regulator